MTHFAANIPGTKPMGSCFTPQGISTVTDAQIRDLVTKTIDEKLGKPIKELADQAKAFKKMKATVAALEQQQIAANAAERCTLPE